MMLFLAILLTLFALATTLLLLAINTNLQLLLGAVSLLPLPPRSPSSVETSSPGRPSTPERSST